jgi:hypothetical protein
VVKVRLLKRILRFGLRKRTSQSEKMASKEGLSQDEKDF